MCDIILTKAEISFYDNAFAVLSAKCPVNRKNSLSFLQVKGQISNKRDANYIIESTF